MPKAKILCYLLIIICFSIITYRFIEVRFLNYSTYLDAYHNKATIIVNGPSAPRGKIYDRNGTILIDNIPINTISYRKLNSNTTSLEINYAKIISNILNLDTPASLQEQKDFYLLTHDTTYLLTASEKKSLTYHELTEDDVYHLKFDRLQDELSNYSPADLINIHTYYLMNNGYYYDTKTIALDVLPSMCALVTEANIPGLSCTISYKRSNIYNLIPSILGSIGPITAENKAEYPGYDSFDLVGLTGLEKYYEETLKGTPATYQVNSDNSLTLITESIPGKDIVLAIDLPLEQEISRILEHQLTAASSLKNTSYYNHSYIIVSNPNTGEIIGLMGLQKITDFQKTIFQDISSNIILSSYTVGSVVKGASHTVGYQNNLISIDHKITDSCVKLYSVPEKCSYKRLGEIDDITALKTSSNYYQFLTAIKSTGNTYYSNMKLEVTKENFDLYRDTFKTYGLGSKTGIDFPKENIGITGSTISPDLLLNLAIGEYDTYTPLQLTSYINTISTSGLRYSLSFLKKNNPIIDHVNLEKNYFARIQEGFFEVVNGGTGRGYTNPKYEPVGKTGTAESYYDYKTTTINQTYIMYAPRTTPKYSIVVMSPNISYNNSQNNYIAPINRYISQEISNFVFENY